MDALDVLFEDAHCLAVAKPAGVLSQGTAGGEPTVEDAVRRHLRPEDPGAVYVGTVHRLDRPVSGVLLWAKTPKAARRLADQFADRRATKEYWAIVEGIPVGIGGLWDDLIGPVDPETRRASIVQVATPSSRPARTRYRRGEAHGLPAGCSWLILHPETGRTHQIRAQATARGLPIVGDVAYGAALPFATGIALHARSLVVEHPATRQPLALRAPLPDSWRSWGLPEGHPVL